MNNLEYLNKTLEIKIDRPMGSKHPKHGFIYPVNYGYVPNTVSDDDEDDSELEEVDNTEEESSENINLENFTIGQNVEDKEPDYSNYKAEEPPETSEEHPDDYEVDYSEYVKKIRKEKHKQHKFSKDMEEY